jgi:type II restriction enzyme
MTINDLIQIYESEKREFGNETYKRLSSILRDAKTQHERDFFNNPKTLKAIEEGKQPDHEQSWRAFKGKNLEKLIQHIVKDEVEDLGLKLINGNQLEKSKEENLSEELAQVRRNLLVDYGEFGYHLPDVDIVIYSPTTRKIIAAISIKVTLRERIAQTGYWKLKLSLSKPLLTLRSTAAAPHGLLFLSGLAARSTPRWAVVVLFCNVYVDGTVRTVNAIKNGRAKKLIQSTAIAK